MHLVAQSSSHGAEPQFLKCYLENMHDSNLLPDDPEELRILLNTFLIDKAIYEIGYELNNRPDWVHVPIEGILDLMETRD